MKPFAARKIEFQRCSVRDLRHSELISAISVISTVAPVVVGMNDRLYLLAVLVSYLRGRSETEVASSDRLDNGYRSPFRAVFLNAQQGIPGL